MGYGREAAGRLVWGWVETGDDVWFAINGDIRTPEDARFRKEALNAAMRETGLIE